MPAARIHEVIAKKINVDYNMDEILIRLGTIAPDCWRNVNSSTGINSKEVSHFWDFKIKQGEANNYVEFYLKYYNKMNNPFYFGYLLHLITDQYWKSTIDPMYVVDRKWRLKDESYYDLDNDSKYFDEEENRWKIKEDPTKNYGRWFGYYETLKMQKKLATKYNLGVLPINREDISNFDVDIDELSLDGLFGEKGTVKFVNGSLDTGIGIEDNESIVYDFDKFEQHINDTVDFIKKELVRLKQIKDIDDSKIKIAVDIDNTILCTEEAKNYYWDIFLKENTDINPIQERTGDNPIIVRFWDEYRDRIAFGKVKDKAPESISNLINEGYRIDLLSSRPLDKYAKLKKQLVDYLENIGIKYNFLNIGFHSKKEFLKEHKYDILIDNEMRHIIDAESVGVTPILYGNNPDYDGYQTDNWEEIPIIIQEIINKNDKRR